MAIDFETVKFAVQSYGIATAGSTFGGPVGIWLECSECPVSHVIVGSNSKEWAAVSDGDVANLFIRHGWTGEGDKLLKARCPQCSRKETP